MGLFKKNKKPEEKKGNNTHDPENEPRPEMLIVELLFKEKPKSATVEEIRAALEKRLGSLGEVPYVEPSKNSSADLVMIPLTKYKVVFKDKPEGMPAAACFMGPMEFSSEKIDDMQRSQFWDVKDGEQLIDSCKWQVMVHAMLSAGLHYKQQAELILAQVGAALDCYPDCCALYVVQSGKLTLPEHFREGEKNGSSFTHRFIDLFVNARFFRISGTENDMVVDTIGFYTFMAADVQMHFHGLTPDHVVNYVYNIADYQFENEFPIKSGDTVDSLDENGKMNWEPQWKSQYENSLIDPPRTVLDINCGKYAAGNRQEPFYGGKQ